MNIIQAEHVLKDISKLNEKLQVIEDKIDALTERLGEFADQIEETVVRIESASRDARDDY